MKKQKAEKENQEPLHQYMMQNAQRYQYIKESQPVLERRTGTSPEDAYSEGYDEGYDQGRSDGVNGHMHGYGYDDSSSYYNHYRNLILQYLDKFGSASREDINVLLWDKLPAYLDEDEVRKKAKIKNLISSLRIDGKIEFINNLWVKC